MGNKRALQKKKREFCLFYFFLGHKILYIPHPPPHPTLSLSLTHTHTHNTTHTNPILPLCYHRVGQVERTGLQSALSCHSDENKATSCSCLLFLLRYHACSLVVHFPLALLALLTAADSARGDGHVDRLRGIASWYLGCSN